MQRNKRSPLCHLLALLPLFLASTLEAAALGQTVRTLVVAEHEAYISAELSARVAKLPFTMGDSFKKGALLVEFTCDTRRAALDESRAERNAARTALAVSEKLHQLQSTSELELAMAKAKVETTTAAFRLREAQYGTCRIYAPFSGRVVAAEIRPYEYAKEGQPILHIVDTDSLELQLFVPSSWIRWIEKGMEITAEIEETGTSCTARIQASSAQIDPKSQTLEISAKIIQPGEELLPGMSGIARFPAPAAP